MTSRRLVRSALVLSTVALALVSANAALGSSGRPHDEESHRSFTITSSISSSASSQIPALLYPGLQRYLWYTVHNDRSHSLTITSLRISGIVAPAACSLSNLDYSLTTFSGSLVVPAHATGSVPVPISLIETGTNQDSCENAVFQFSLAGTATRADSTDTTTELSTDPNPSSRGELVTLKAVVRTHSGLPTGSVAFYLGTPGGSHSLLGSSGLDGAARATLTTSSLPVGDDSLFALYGGDATYSSSTSPPVTQRVTSSSHCSSGDGGGSHGSHARRDSPVGTPGVSGSSAAKDECGDLTHVGGHLSAFGGLNLPASGGAASPVGVALRAVPDAVMVAREGIVVGVAGSDVAATLKGGATRSLACPGATRLATLTNSASVPRPAAPAGCRGTTS